MRRLDPRRVVEGFETNGFAGALAAPPNFGGFQICDYVPAIRKYFDETEIVMARIDAAEWIEKVEYFLRQEEARRDIQERGIKRALAEHMYTNRVELVLKLVRDLRG